MRRAALSERDEHKTDFRVQLLVCLYLLGCRYTSGAVYSVNCYKCIHPNLNLYLLTQSIFHGFVLKLMVIDQVMLCLTRCLPCQWLLPIYSMLPSNSPVMYTINEKVVHHQKPYIQTLPLKHKNCVYGSYLLMLCNWGEWVEWVNIVWNCVNDLRWHVQFSDPQK